MRTTSHEATNTVVEVSGLVPDAEPDHARAVVSRLLAHTAEPVPYVRIRLTVVGNPSLPRPALAQVNLDLDGRLVRAQAAAPTMREAIDLMRDRLATRLGKAARTWENPHGRAV